MKTLTPLALAAGLCLAGCARFTTTQTDLSYDDTGKPQRQVTTTVKATAFFAASSDLAKFKALQTDKTQSAAVGALNQRSDATNVVDLVERAIGAAVTASIKAAAP